MMKLPILFGCLIVVVNSVTNGGQQIRLEDIEREYNSNQKASSYVQPKASSSAVSSPTKFGFVPKRTASSYAATKPKTQYLQTNYKVKQSGYQAPVSEYQQKYQTQYAQPQTTYQQQYSSGSNQQYTVPSDSLNYASQYSSGSQQYFPQQQAQEYAYGQPDEQQQQYTVQYQQPSQQYEQYENVQYVTDNSVSQPETQTQQYYSQAPQPQYYYVQQYQSPSNAVESVVNPKAAQYLTYIPPFSPNSIPIDQKQLEAYFTSSGPQLPPITTTVAKYTTVTPSKTSSSKQHVSHKGVQYVGPSVKTQYHQQDEILIKREPKSLLDSYVPSIVQLQYLRQQGKSGH